MFLSRNKKNNVYPCKPQKMGFKGGQIYVGIFFVMHMVLYSNKKNIMWISHLAGVFDIVLTE